MNEIFAVYGAAGCGRSLMPVATSAVYVFPSYHEATSRTVLEAMAMEAFILNPERIISMGAASRQLAEEKFDIDSVNKVMLQEMGL